MQPTERDHLLVDAPILAKSIILYTCVRLAAMYLNTDYAIAAVNVGRRIPC